jgi:hypothetical protein
MNEDVNIKKIYMHLLFGNISTIPDIKEYSKAFEPSSEFHISLLRSLLTITPMEIRNLKYEFVGKDMVF